MSDLKKILEEIEQEFDRRINIKLKIMCGLGDDTYRYRYGKSLEDYQQGKLLVTDIIRKHMSGKDTNFSTNDGWIPVKKEWPPFGQRLQATILHHEWVSDYNSAWVPEEEKNHHPAYTEVCEIYPIGALWCYNCAEDDYNGDVAYIEPAKCLSRPVAEIIAWRPLPEPYRPGKER